MDRPTRVFDLVLPDEPIAIVITALYAQLPTISYDDGVNASTLNASITRKFVLLANCTPW